MKFIEFIEEAFGGQALTSQVNAWLEVNGPIEIVYTEETDAYHDCMFLGRRYKIFYEEAKPVCTLQTKT
jgi:hypothetical protein